MKLKYITAALLTFVFSSPALAYDCSDFLRWDLSERIKNIERRFSFYRFNPSYYTNVPGWPGVEYDVEKICLKDKYKYLDNAIDEASFKNGMIKP